MSTPLHPDGLLYDQKSMGQDQNACFCRLRTRAFASVTGVWQPEKEGLDKVLSKEKGKGSPETGEFFPKGAIAFFAAMLIGFGLIWLGMYLLLVLRQF